MFKSDLRPLVTGASAIFKVADHPVLGSNFVWMDRFEEQYLAFRERDGYWHFPRECFPVGGDQRIRASTTNFPVCMPARDESQARVLGESLELLSEGRSHQVKASTGWGKTWLGCALAARLGQHTLIVVPKTDGMRDWRLDIEKFLGIKPDDVGHIQANKCRVGEHLTLATLQSICKPGRYPEEVYRSFGLVIFDEVDRVGADKFQDACFNLPARLRLGLTATDRKDGRNVLVEAHMGRVLVEHAEVPMTPQVLRYRTGWRCPRDRKTKRPIPHKGGRDTHVVKILTRSVRRNELITSLVHAARLKERHVLVFSHLRDHLATLAELLVETGCPKEEIGFYQGGEAKLEEAAHKPVTLATYGMAGRGTNYPHWEVCILATPRADVRQAVGRVLRKHPGKKQPAIIDLIDDDSPLYEGYMYARTAYYRSPEVAANPISDCD
ncbi:MAG: DEAD/DEAH box helicase family protein [Acidobacteriota bacterium]